jgi:hypothetical protein
LSRWLKGGRVVGLIAGEGVVRGGRVAVTQVAPVSGSR